VQEVIVKIPEGRVTEFYVMLGRWLGEEEKRRRENRGRRSGPSRYDGIAELLRRFSEETNASTLTFAFGEIEDAIGDELPASARKHRAWWANTDRNTQVRVWMRAGWMVETVYVAEGVVEFVRS
jgi:hypothetical protein